MRNRKFAGLLLKYLNSESYRNQLADAAIEAMRSQDDPAYIAPLLETLRKREADFRSQGFAGGLRTLAYLARNEEKKDAVRDFLLGYVNDKKRAFKLPPSRPSGRWAIRGPSPCCKRSPTRPRKDRLTASRGEGGRRTPGRAQTGG
jgi:hypothetical protein